ncbi:MAG TPA: hypothetical protein VHD61_15815 [Lacunisphaera sp.]|nr:hypothetical protein [Lacunisphaera sp.]
MRTKREPRAAKADGDEKARVPRVGVRKLPVREGRPNPFGVQWAERVWVPEMAREVRKVKTKFYPSADLRDRRFHELKDEKRAGALRTISRAEIDQWHAFKAAIGDTPWPEVVAGWRGFLRVNGLTPCTLKVAELFGDCLVRAEAAKDAGKLSADTFRQKKHKWGLFTAAFGRRTISDIQPSDIERWLDGFAFESNITRDVYLKHVRLPFAIAMKRRLLQANPCDQVEKMGVQVDAVRHLPVEAVAKLFHTAQTHRDKLQRQPFRVMLARLALEFFAGIRFGSATRLTKSDINGKECGLLHPRPSIKTRKRQYIEGYPDVLWAWLKIAPEEGWSLTPRQYLELKSRLFVTAGVPHPHNTARHSFCTYHVAVRRDASLTAFLLCHVNARKLWDTYKGNATREEGERYENLTPERVATVARLWKAAPPAPNAAAPDREPRQEAAAPAGPISTAAL